MLSSYIKSFASRHEAIIINFHSIISHHLPFQIAHHLPVEIFESQLNYIKRYFHCVSLEQLINNVSSGVRKKRQIAITFDDGYHNNLPNALPLLEKYRIPATLFVVTDYIGKEDLLWPEKLACILFLTERPHLNVDNTALPISTKQEKETSYQHITRHFKQVPPEHIAEYIINFQAQTGISDSDIYRSEYYQEFKFLDMRELHELNQSQYIAIGSHTRTHRRLSKLGLQEAKEEIAGSKEMLEHEFGKISFFAYPFGSSDTDYFQEHTSYAQVAGYRAAMSAEYNTVSPPLDFYQIPRVNINCQDGITGFRYMLNGGVAFKSGFDMGRVIRGIVTGFSEK